MMPRLWLFTGLGLLLVAGAVGFAWWQGGESPSLPSSRPAASSSSTAATPKSPGASNANVPGAADVSEPVGETGGEEQPPPGPISALPPDGFPERPPQAHDWPDEATLKKQQAGK